MLTKEKLRELADAGVECITIVVDDPVAYAATLVPDVDFTYGEIKEHVSVTTLNGAPALSRSLMGSGWLRFDPPRHHMTIYVKSAAKVVPLTLATAAA